jgi:NAD(P)-dependent dehydrogenase (short-subunit alcohol dehydrogenase family)
MSSDRDFGPHAVLAGKCAIVTGGASGMGRASSILFAQSGASVVVADVNDEQGEAVAAACRVTGNNALYQRADVAHEADMKALVARAVDEFGRLDVMYNNAGVPGPVGVEEASVEDWDAACGVMLRGTFLGMKYAIPALRRSGGGSIISTSSTGALRPNAAQAAYSACKAAIVALTASVAQLVGRDRIRVNAIAPGWIHTPMLYAQLPGGASTALAMQERAQPIERAGMPEDVAHAALFLASDASSFITGIVLPVDGGYTAQLIERPETMEVFAAAAASADVPPAWLTR